MNSLWTLKLLRIAIAYVFITSALTKYFNPDFQTMFVQLGLPFPQLLFYTVMMVELIGGLMLLFNKAIQFAAIPLIGIMLAAIALTKLPTIATGIMEFAFSARLDITVLILLLIIYKSKQE